MISEGFKGASFLPQPYKETDDKNITTRSMILKYIL
tara:strand:+ start:728 stop:835 length:108 start_codon:yes stop_codon:yes gene_type:complete